MFGDATNHHSTWSHCRPGDSSFRFTYWPYRIAQGGVKCSASDGGIPFRSLMRAISLNGPFAWWKTNDGTFNAVGPAKPMDIICHSTKCAKAWPPTRTALHLGATEFLAEQKCSPCGTYPPGFRAATIPLPPRAAISPRAQGWSNLPSVAAVAADALAWFNEHRKQRAQMLEGVRDDADREKRRAGRVA